MGKCPSSTTPHVWWAFLLDVASKLPNGDTQRPICSKPRSQERGGVGWRAAAEHGERAAAAEGLAQRLHLREAPAPAPELHWWSL